MTDAYHGPLNTGMYFRPIRPSEVAPPPYPHMGIVEIIELNRSPLGDVVDGHNTLFVTYNYVNSPHGDNTKTTEKSFRETFVALTGNERRIEEHWNRNPERPPQKDHSTQFTGGALVINRVFTTSSLNGVRQGTVKFIFESDYDPDDTAALEKAVDDLMQHHKREFTYPAGSWVKHRFVGSIETLEINPSGGVGRYIISMIAGIVGSGIGILLFGHLL